MKRTHFASDFSVGFVLFVATAVVIASLFVVGDGKSFFEDHVEYVVSIPQASGLKNGSKVLVGGVPCGTVSRIAFPDDLEQTGVLVTISVEKSYRTRIREDSYVWIENQGLLGDREIHVKVGTAGAQELASGSTIPFRDRPMLDTLAGQEIRQDTTQLIKSMVSVLEDINKGQGSLGQLIKNPELYDNLNKFTASMNEATKQFEVISKDLSSIIAEVRGQKGTLGQLLFSEEYAATFARALREAGTLVANLSEISEGIKTGKGSVGRLFTSPELAESGRKAIDDVGRIAARLDSILTKAEDSASVLGRFATSEQLGRDFEGLVTRLSTSADHLEKVLAKVDRGEGSIGMLVNDPSIAGSLRDLFLGVKEAGLMVNMVRRAEQDGREAYLFNLNLARQETEEVLRVRALARMKGKPSEGGATPVPAAGPALEPERDDGGKANGRLGKQPE